MALGKKQHIVFEFYDADGDHGEWWFTPEATRGFTNLVNEKYGEGLDRVYGQVKERTLKCDGPGMSLAEDHEYEGTVYKKGTVIPLHDPNLRDHFIDDVVPEDVTAGAITFLMTHGRVRSPEEWKEFQKTRPPVVRATARNGKSAGRGREPAETVE